jgi:hypothetical protein
VINKLKDLGLPFMSNFQWKFIGNCAGYVFDEASLETIPEDYDPYSDPTHVDFGFWFTEQNMTMQRHVKPCQLLSLLPFFTNCVR